MPSPYRATSFSAYTVGTVLFAILLFAGLAGNLIKYRGLAFHQRDYPFILEFSAKLLDPSLSSHYSINPKGRSYLGFRQTDGKTGFHRLVHFQPIRYLDAVLYRLFRTPVVLFVWRSAVLALPLLYVGCLASRYDEPTSHFLTLLGVAYLLIPSNVQAASYDLRPYALPSPLLFMLVLGAVYQRPISEMLLLLIALFAMREESLMLALLTLVLHAASAALVPRIPITPPARSRAWLLWAAWLVFLCATILYYTLGGFEPKVPEELEFLLETSLNPVLALCGFTLVIAGTTHQRLLKGVIWGTLGVMIASFGVQFVITVALGRPLPSTLRILAKRPRWQACWVVILLVLAVAWIQARQARTRKMVVAVTSALIGLFLTLWCLPGISPVSAFLDYWRGIPDARLVFSQRRTASPMSTAILCDYDTHQAFYDLESVFDYERLPWYLAERHDRFPPRNRALLLRLLREEIDRIVISRDAEEDVLSLVEEADLTSRLRLLDGNATYVAYEMVQ
jgi:hypothetical protein